MRSAYGYTVIYNNVSKRYTYAYALKGLSVCLNAGLWRPNKLQHSNFKCAGNTLHSSFQVKGCFHLVSVAQFQVKILILHVYIS